MLAHDYLLWFGAQLVSIAILVFFIVRWRPGFLNGKTIGRTLTSALDTRAAAIEEQLGAAQRSRDEAARIREGAAQDIADARVQAEDIVNRAAQTSQAIQREMETRAREEYTRVVGQARGEIDYERRQAVLALRRRASDIVIDPAHEVIARTMDGATGEQLIRRSLSQIRDVQ